MIVLYIKTLSTVNHRIMHTVNNSVYLPGILCNPIEQIRYYSTIGSATRTLIQPKGFLVKNRYFFNRLKSMCVLLHDKITHRLL